MRNPGEAFLACARLKPTLGPAAALDAKATSPDPKILFRFVLSAGVLPVMGELKPDRELLREYAEEGSEPGLGDKSRK